MMFGTEETRMVGLPDGEKFWRYVYSFWQNVRTWQTYRRTDRQTPHDGKDYLVLEQAAAERPDAGEDEVQLVPLLGAVSRRVLRRQQALQQEAQHLQVTVVADRRDLLELERQTRRDVFVEENSEVGAFWLDLTRVNPTTHVPADYSYERFTLDENTLDTQPNESRSFA